MRTIRRAFLSLEWVQITKSVQWNFAIIRVLPFLNNLKDLDPSYKMDLDFWDCFGREKPPSYKWRNTVSSQLHIKSKVLILFAEKWEELLHKGGFFSHSCLAKNGSVFASIWKFNVLLSYSIASFEQLGPQFCISLFKTCYDNFIHLSIFLFME